MSTKKLARELGIIRKRSQNKESAQSKRPGIKQYFSYLIIIDFESTCWREKNNYGQEIIEFPAVLLNTSNGAVESEFHTYVQPQEHPILSEFCTELTGITQTQVEAGVPLAICLSRFTRWLHSLQQEKGVVFLREGKAPLITGHPCAFVTWSDWDLGVCLLYECKRKQICKPEVLNSWIDLRATYKLFYSRKPKGLNGALQDLGIEFSGREHSGLDDARNTARLAWRMMTDGCCMKITKSLDRAPLKSKSLFPSNPANNNSSNPSEPSNTDAKHGPRKQCSENSPPQCTAKPPPTDSTTPAHPTRHGVSVNQNPVACVNINQNKSIHQQYQSLVTPKTVLGDLSSRLSVGGTMGSMTRHQRGTTLLTGSSPSPETTSLVLVSTVVSMHADNVLPRQLNFDLEASDVDCTDGVVLLPETEESGSYDDVLLEEEEHVEEQNYAHGVGLKVSTNRSAWGEVPTNSSTWGEGPRKTGSLLASLAAPSTVVASVGWSKRASTGSLKQTTLSTTPSTLAVVKNLSSSTGGDDACFKMPRPVSAPTRENHRSVLRPFINTTTTPNPPNDSNYRLQTLDPSALNYSCCNTTSTPSRFETNLSLQKLSTPSSSAPRFSLRKTTTPSSSAPSLRLQKTTTPSSSTPGLSLQKTASPICSTTDCSPEDVTSCSSVSKHSLCNAATRRDYFNKNTASKGSVLNQSSISNGIKNTSKSFTIYQDIESQPVASTSTQTAIRGFSSVPPSVLSSRVNQSRPTVSRAEETKKVTVTSPLCDCGRRAKRLTVGNGGPNHGRGFYCCPVRRSGPGNNGPPKKGCQFFKWESALLASVTPGAFKKTPFSRTSTVLAKTLR